MGSDLYAKSFTNLEFGEVQLSFIVYRLFVLGS